MKGWISLHRKILDNPLLSTGRTFSRFEAWVWLLLNANHSKAKVVMGAEMFIVKRGSMITSQKKLCKKFKWGNSRLRSFLNLLEKDDMIRIKTTSKLTCLTILNYNSYQNIKLELRSNQDSNKLPSNTNNNKSNNKYNNENKTTTKNFKKFLSYKEQERERTGDIGSSKYWEGVKRESEALRKKMKENEEIIKMEENEE